MCGIKFMTGNESQTLASNLPAKMDQYMACLAQAYCCIQCYLSITEAADILLRVCDHVQTRCSYSGIGQAVSAMLRHRHFLLEAMLCGLIMLGTHLAEQLLEGPRHRCHLMSTQQQNRCLAHQSSRHRWPWHWTSLPLHLQSRS